MAESSLLWLLHYTVSPFNLENHKGECYVELKANEISAAWIQTCFRYDDEVPLTLYAIA
jgi:hypothetical protein